MRLHAFRAHVKCAAMNVTLSIDERVITRARQVAAVRSTNLDKFIRDYLEEMACPSDAESPTGQLGALWSGSTARSQGIWTREVLRERSCVHRRVPPAQRCARLDTCPNSPRSRDSRDDHPPGIRPPKGRFRLEKVEVRGKGPQLAGSLGNGNGKSRGSVSISIVSGRNIMRGYFETIDRRRAFVCGRYAPFTLQQLLGARCR